MPFKVIGLIAGPANTLTRLTKLETDPAKAYPCAAIFIQARAANTGDVFIGNAAMVKGTGVGVARKLEGPAATFQPAFDLVPGGAGGPNTLSLADLYIDPDVADDGVYVAVVQV